ncbi:MAG: GNAT family N-acetyltransferase [Myxococcales bacterium]|nr:GNAT family N-acetyltransferase [Myxococcales bacterium]
MRLHIPSVETERLTLSAHRPEDLDDLLALWTDPVVTRYLGRPATREEAWARLQRYIGHWALFGHGFWAIRERATGRFVGDTGIGDLQRDLAVSFDGAPEAGWVLASWAHGLGYATEAMTAVLAWAGATHPRTVCIIRTDNTASLRVAAKLGYRELARAPYHGQPVIAFERLLRA